MSANDPLANDARRYRWLRDKSEYAELGTPSCILDEGCLEGRIYIGGEKLDAAIDAELAKEEE